MLIYGSVCSGIEAATAAWHPLGWRAAFYSEIDAFPRAVLKHHYPDVPLHGDFTTIREGDYAAIDVLVGGTPCQSFSVAGLRGGLADGRGNLALEYLRLAQRLRTKWLVWENVPGVLSSNGGRDFGSILGGLVELGYGFAYRVLDAQYVRVDGFGRAVPQRRRRVFVVGHLGDWRRAAAVLFERASLAGHPAPRREAGQGAAPTLAARTRGGGGLGTDFDCDGGRIVNSTAATLTRGAESSGKGGFDASEDGTGRGTPLVPVGVALRGRDDGATAELTGEVMTALRCGGGGGDKPHVLTPVAFAENSRGELRLQSGDGSIAPQLTIGGGKPGQGFPAIAFQGDVYACTQEANAGALLRRVREALGEEAFAEWGLGILDTLQSQEILRSALHGSELRPTSFLRRWVVYCALSREKERSEGALQSLREAERAGRPSQGRKPSEQLCRELGTYLSELSQPGAQADRFMQDLWLASEGLGVLQQALSAIQKARRPSRREGEPAPTDWRVRRLTPEEAEFLQGFPRGYTAIRYRGKPASDGPRYKAIGNSMAVNVVRWIGWRIELVEASRKAEGIAA